MGRAAIFLPAVTVRGSCTRTKVSKSPVPSTSEEQV